jgi:hypothetical protein
MEYVEEKTTRPLKIKQTSITTVRYPILTVARLSTPLIFHYPLLLSQPLIHVITGEACPMYLCLPAKISSLAHPSGHQRPVQGAGDKLGQFLDQGILATAYHGHILQVSLKSWASLV